ncbi:MAG: hypothetical protein GTO40_30260 [Deltaproteobacteria bacterium]|nr:hypothetical protein [Deltaproteobacteria bacterium]
MAVVRLIHVTVKPNQTAEVESLWKNHCAPLMIKQPGCLSERLLRCEDAPGEYISYSEWSDQDSIDKYRKSPAHEEIIQRSRELQLAERPTVKRYAVV